MVHPQHNCVGGVPTVQLPGSWHLQIRLASDYCLVWLVKEPLYILRDTFVRQNPVWSFVKFAGCAGNARSVPQHPVLGTTVTYPWDEILRHYGPGWAFQKYTISLYCSATAVLERQNPPSTALSVKSLSSFLPVDGLQVQYVDIDAEEAWLPGTMEASTGQQQHYCFCWSSAHSAACSPRL